MCKKIYESTITKGIGEKICTIFLGLVIVIFFGCNSYHLEMPEKFEVKDFELKLKEIEKIEKENKYDQQDLLFAKALIYQRLNKDYEALKIYKSLGNYKYKLYVLYQISYIEQSSFLGVMEQLQELNKSFKEEFKQENINIDLILEKYKDDSKQYRKIDRDFDKKINNIDDKLQVLLSKQEFRDLYNKYFLKLFDKEFYKEIGSIDEELKDNFKKELDSMINALQFFLHNNKDISSGLKSKYYFYVGLFSIFNGVEFRSITVQENLVKSLMLGNYYYYSILADGILASIYDCKSFLKQASTKSLGIRYKKNVKKDYVNNYSQTKSLTIKQIQKLFEDDLKTFSNQLDYKLVVNKLEELEFKSSQYSFLYKDYIKKLELLKKESKIDKEIYEEYIRLLEFIRPFKWKRDLSKNDFKSNLELMNLFYQNNLDIEFMKFLDSFYYGNNKFIINKLKSNLYFMIIDDERKYYYSIYYQNQSNRNYFEMVYNNLVNDDKNHSLIYKNLIKYMAKEKYNGSDKYGRLNLIKLFPDNYIDIIKKEDFEQFVDDYEILALIRAESYFNTAAVSYMGARGLFQFMPSTAKWLDRKGYKVEKLNNPEYAVKLAYKYFEFLDERIPQNIMMYAGYNGGHNRFKSYFDGNMDLLIDIERIHITETQIYCKKIIRNYLVNKVLYSKNALNTEIISVFKKWGKYENN